MVCSFESEFRPTFKLVHHNLIDFVNIFQPYLDCHSYSALRQLAKRQHAKRHYSAPSCFPIFQLASVDLIKHFLLNLLIIISKLDYFTHKTFFSLNALK